MCDFFFCGYLQQFLEKILKLYIDEKFDQDLKKLKGCESLRIVNGRDKSDFDFVKEKIEIGRYRYL